MLALAVVCAEWVCVLGSHCTFLLIHAHRGALWASSTPTVGLARQRTVVLSAYCMNQRGSLVVHSLLGEVQRNEAMAVGKIVDLGYRLGVQISAECAVSVERPSVPEVVFLCL